MRNAFQMVWVHLSHEYVQECDMLCLLEMVIGIPLSEHWHCQWQNVDV